MKSLSARYPAPPDLAFTDFGLRTRAWRSATGGGSVSRKLALSPFSPRHRVDPDGALDIFPLRALDVDQSPSVA
jgi:hypothetical protein